MARNNRYPYRIVEDVLGDRVTVQGYARTAEAAFRRAARCERQFAEHNPGGGLVAYRVQQLGSDGRYRTVSEEG
jgi:hypothetical protein